MFNFLKKKTKSPDSEKLDPVPVTEPATERYKTVQHYLWDRDTSQLRLEVDIHPYNYKQHYTDATAEHVMEFGFTKLQALQLIWDEYVRRVGIHAAYREVRELIKAASNDQLTRPVPYAGEFDFEDFCEDDFQKRFSDYPQDTLKSLIYECCTLKTYPLDIVIDSIRSEMNERFEGATLRDSLALLDRIITSEQKDIQPK